MFDHFIAFWFPLILNVFSINPSYLPLDMLTCSIKLAEAEIRTNNITTNCGLESVFGALGAAVQDINGTMSLDLGKMW